MQKMVLLVTVPLCRVLNFTEEAKSRTTDTGATIYKIGMIRLY